MTKSTDFSELSSIINTVASNMQLTDEQYQQISDTLKALDGSVFSGLLD